MFRYSRSVIFFLSIALAVRAAIGGFAYFFPSEALSAFNVDLGQSGHGLYMLMVFGMRDIMIVVMILLAPRDYVKTLILCCIGIEISDFAAATLIYLDGAFTQEQWLGQLGAVFGALIPETIALALAYREDRARGLAVPAQ